ncbi:MAG: serine--tRNA ligase [Candidatus Omnitrophica bacterium]|nr:serine--tRNA ligase [Candidatus Omnitrophota bacterium]
MLDIKLIRENTDTVKAGLKAKNVNIDLDVLLELDKKRRGITQAVDALRSQVNTANEEIGLLIKEKKDAKEKISAMKDISRRIDDLQPDLKELDEKISTSLLMIPNLPHASVPVGSPANNQHIRSWGTPKEFDFKPKTHIELAEALDIIDFKRATKISGSNFILYKGMGARLERALYCWMLDLHTTQHAYTEIFPPFLVNAASMTGTGQLPKMKDDMYHLSPEDLYLIPTAEVPVTNIHRDEMLSAEQLPINYAAYTACFRREAGSYGKDTRGLVRVHQFDKVELVKFVKPESSYDELEALVGHAEKVLQLLNLPYRVLMLASGDMSFAAAKCYDLEAHAPGLGNWLEVSSCSNFEDFQARRANIRYRDKETKKPMFVHTLNGSGVALARTMVAILENYQTKTGEIMIPEPLRPYMGGLDMIIRP